MVKGGSSSFRSGGRFRGVGLTFLFLSTDYGLFGGFCFDNFMLLFAFMLFSCCLILHFCFFFILFAIENASDWQKFINRSIAPSSATELRSSGHRLQTAVFSSLSSEQEARKIHRFETIDIFLYAIFVTLSDKKWKNGK